LYSYCAKRSFVTYLTEVLGDWQLEVECELEDVGELMQLLRDLRITYSDNVMDYDVIKVIKEEKLNYFPMGEKAFDELELPTGSDNVHT
jgi:hypothetical protein